jgi:hypothetical protein
MALGYGEENANGQNQLKGGNDANVIEQEIQQLRNPQKKTLGKSQRFLGFIRNRDMISKC